MKTSAIVVPLLPVLAALAVPAILVTSSPVRAAEGTVEAEGAVAEQERKAPHKKVVVKKKQKAKGGAVVVRRRAAGTPVHVVRPVVVRRRAVVVHSGPPVVTAVAVVPARRREVVEAQYDRRHSEDSMLGIGVRVGGVTVDGEKLNLATMENPTMWGPGLQFRGKISPNVGLELSADYLVGQSGDVTQTTVPVTLSAMYYFIPRGSLKLFGLLGGGVHLTKLEYDRGLRHDLVEVAGQAGGGVELRLSKDFGLNADLRFIGVYKNLGETESIEHKCLSQSPAYSCGGVNQAEKFNIGAQFMVGASLYF